MEVSPHVRVRRFEQLPSSTLFTSQIESMNVPAVFSGCIKDWEALVKWNPASGGLHYLQERAGSCIVEAMLSRDAPIFYGDIRSHERVPLPFATFVGFCKQRLKHGNADSSAYCDNERHQLAESVAEQDAIISDDAPQPIYLAQVPIMNSEDKGRVQLETLVEDIHKPTILETKELASVNLWMNNAQTRSSTHYDPHHNLLCVVAGSKKVVLWPPSACPSLYPMPIYGEASNHSAVGLENPDLSSYPRAKDSMEYCQKVTLHAGDALFIPEGWFHQVDSENLTIAVNFWWRSNIMSGMLEHMDAYYLRRILRRLVDNEMNQVLHRASSLDKVNPHRHACELLSNGERDDKSLDEDQSHETQGLLGKDLLGRCQLDQMEPLALQAVHELVSLVHQEVNIGDHGQPVQSISTSDSAVGMKGECYKVGKSNIFILEGDPVAQIFWNLDPLTLRDVLLGMVHNFPRTLEAMILHLLSPVAAEVLTRKFDSIDQLTSEEDRNKFYQVFYSAFHDQFAAMDALLNGKESFAFLSFKNVLDKYLGVNSDIPKPSV
ncbi:hypothetical protein K2173_018426 [Erythroxylum novogranatense]|uniref:JmjC domain-containing protein n=1 Tax=Erythroxylum novogranatense TaxID=1862640 RepID=A0AAV8UDY9_9ROSI|nr:hypothetical protein K2173_018426 [Erythroxylum novogranatense]